MSKKARLIWAFQKVNFSFFWSVELDACSIINDTDGVKKLKQVWHSPESFAISGNDCINDNKDSEPKSQVVSNLTSIRKTIEFEKTSVFLGMNKYTYVWRNRNRRNRKLLCHGI